MKINQTINPDAQIIKKLLYKMPEITHIQLDNEISLALESTPPFPGDETKLGEEYNKVSPIGNNYC